VDEVLNISEKYRPKKEDEWIGDKSVLTSLESYIQNDITSLLVGKPGIGKTSAVYLVANKLGYEVIESNASDQRKTLELKDLKIRLGTNTFVKTVFLLDEVDGIETSGQNLLSDIVKTSKHPVVMTANDTQKLTPNLKKSCKLIEVEIKQQDLGAIVKRMKEIAKKEGLEVTYEKVTTDIRSSINCTFEGSQKYIPEENNFEKVKNIYKKGKVEKIPLIWLIDNALNFYHGKELYDVIQILSLVAETNNQKILELLPRATKGTPTFPYYYRRLKNESH
jgi:DNA polymerase III delta prime subunit